MKVMKFGGTSVGSAKSIKVIKKIVSESKESVIVVVSAVGGVTDLLLQTTSKAACGDESYLLGLEKIKEVHSNLYSDLFEGEKLKKVSLMTNSKLDELSKILQGVFLIGESSKKSVNHIVSYGERISSLFIAEYLDAVHYDSRKYIKTKSQYNNNILEYDITEKNIKEAFVSLPKVSVVAGFIARDFVSGDITNLGRGGSDYTASIFAAVLNASVLEIWTDVDGFMTADPNVINNAYVIDRLSYVEAMELCNFGAKVIYPPTIFPVYHKKIPIRIKNTFNPSALGTYISSEIQDKDNSIKGISSINQTSLITIAGMGMVGIIGVNYRIFKVLAKSGISVFMVSQASSENTTSIGVKTADSQKAVEVLKKEFYKELEVGSINKIVSEDGLATVAIVGENMKRTPGIAGKLFSALGRSGINVIACAQGASETNISFVTKSSSLKKTLNVIHESFFLTGYQELNLFIVGVGTVGGSLLDQIRHQQDILMKQNNLKLNVVGIAKSSKAIFNRDGLNLSNYAEEIEKNGVPNSPELLKDAILDMNIFNSVFVDCTAAAPIAKLYKEMLDNNINVVAANKISASSEYSLYKDLKDIARRKGIKYLFETNVGAGLPVISTMNSLINSGDKILKIQAVLSGTLNFIFNELSQDIPLSKTIKLAQEAGFAEPDPRIDLSGTDVIRKLVILAREAGYVVEQSDVKKNLFVPDEYFEGSLEDFWSNIVKLDSEFEEKRKKLEKENKKYRFVATMEQGRCSVGLEAVSQDHPFYDLKGSNNIVSLTTKRYNEDPMIIKGYGAGASVTSAGVFGDIMSIANIR